MAQTIDNRVNEEKEDNPQEKIVDCFAYMTSKDRIGYRIAQGFKLLQASETGYD